MDSQAFFYVKYLQKRYIVRNPYYICTDNVVKHLIF
jgi:hypothetical protein